MKGFDEERAWPQTNLIAWFRADPSFRQGRF